MMNPFWGLAALDSKSSEAGDGGRPCGQGGDGAALLWWMSHGGLASKSCASPMWMSYSIS
jgi:hypothetical protein